MNKKRMVELWKLSFGKNKDERVHAIAMLLIYGIFIFVVILMVRFSPSSSSTTKVVASPTLSPTATTDNEESDTLDSNISADVNYSYIYTITVNGVKEIITGQKYDEKEKFTIINDKGTNEYAKLSENFLQKENGEYTIIDSPSEYYKYCDMETILSLLDNKGSVISDNYYSVKVEDLIMEFDDDTYTGIVDKTDTIKLTLENNELRKVELDFSNYFSTQTNGAKTSFTIVMNFNDVGTTKDFDLTIE